MKFFFICSDTVRGLLPRKIVRLMGLLSGRVVWLWSPNPGVSGSIPRKGSRPSLIGESESIGRGLGSNQPKGRVAGNQKSNRGRGDGKW